MIKASVSKNFYQALYEENNIIKFTNNHYQETPLAIKIINCGHGNWNEIHTENKCYIYDLGAGLWLKGIDVESLVRKRFAELKESKKEIHIIISHWDKDHYQGLLRLEELEKDTLENIKSFIAPRPAESKLNQATVKKVLQIIDDKINYQKTCFIQPIKRKSSKKTYLVSKNNSIYWLYKGKEVADINRAGILLAIKANNKTAIFPADHSWDQINGVLEKQESSITNGQLLIVTPHHGGKAGDLSILKKLVKNYVTPLHLCTSCDEEGNNYGHPSDEFIKVIDPQIIKHARTDKIKSNKLGETLKYVLNSDSEKYISLI